MARPSIQFPPTISRRSILQRLHVSPGRLVALIHEHDFPRPIRLGDIERWDAVAVQRWLDARLTDAEPKRNAESVARPGA